VTDFDPRLTPARPDLAAALLRGKIAAADYVERGDVERMATLYEPDAALACGDGRIAVGTDAIRKFYTDLLAAGQTFDLGEVRPAMLRENLALTSTRIVRVLSSGTRKPWRWPRKSSVLINFWYWI
jgi:hypothetical protein